jgi:two-component system, OmpR family, phosphate regulon sensor histidine kinase PhoR
MKTSFFRRVFAGYLLIILLLSGVSLLVFSVTFRDTYRQMLSDNLRTLALALGPEVTTLVSKGDPLRLQGFVGQSGIRLGRRLTVVDGAGKVLADSDENPRAMENHRNRPELAVALGGNTGKSTRFSSTTNQEALYVAIPLRDRSGVTVGALRTAMFVKDVRFPPGLMTQMITVALVLALLGLAVALILSRSMSRPIKDLTDAAHGLAAGDYSTRVFFRRNDEFKALADTFNSMSRDIRTAFEEQAIQRNELKGIIDALREGLIVVDKKGVVIYSNESMRTALDCHVSMEGGYYWETLREPGILELLEKARGGMLDGQEEVEILGKTYLCSTARVEPQEETILVLHDITGRKEMERIKRDLVSNVSHELRTPLTSIKGFAETLEEEVDEKYRRYAEIIRKNADRLINIVGDLLLLSQLEERTLSVEPEPMDLSALVEKTMEVFQAQAKKKGLSLLLEKADNLPLLIADSFRIEQMVINLLDNAIKYTDQGEVRIVLGKEDQGLTIEICDTGIGIPREQISRIFERFYVVDKSRSRKTGGTGLGLSIVKHIVLLHGGEVSAESTPGKGTCFTVHLPIRRT